MPHGYNINHNLLQKWPDLPFHIPNECSFVFSHRIFKVIPKLGVINSWGRFGIWPKLDPESHILIGLNRKITMDCVPEAASMWPSESGNGNESGVSYTLYGNPAQHKNVSMEDRHDSLYEQIEKILFQKVVIAACVLGIIGNLLSLVVLSRKSLTTSMERMEKSAHYGLVALVSSDLCLALIILPHAWVDHTMFAFYTNSFALYYIVYENAFINIFIFSSTWLTVSLATNRYLAICHPLKARQILGLTVTKFMIGAVFVGSILFNLPKFWTYQVASLECLGNWTVYYHIPGYLQKHPNLDHAHMWTYFLLGILVPTLVLAYCNCNLILVLRRSLRMRKQYRHSESRESHHCVTLMLVVIILMHLLLFMPSEVITFLKFMVIADTTIADEFNLASAVANTLQAINFSLNFIIYCAMNSRFRHEVGHIFCCCSCSRKPQVPQHIYFRANVISVTDHSL